MIETNGSLFQNHITQNLIDGNPTLLIFFQHPLHKEDEERRRSLLKLNLVFHRALPIVLAVFACVGFAAIGQHIDTYPQRINIYLLIILSICKQSYFFRNI